MVIEIHCQVNSIHVIHQVHHKLFSLLTKARHNLPTVHDRGRGYSNSLKTSAEGYTLPTRFDTSARRSPRIDIRKVCEVQIIKQTLSLVYSSMGSFPRARDTDSPVPAPLVLPTPGCRTDGNLQEGKFPITTWFGNNPAWDASIKDETRPPILK
jgi:hypothetical protein